MGRFNIPGNITALGITPDDAAEQFWGYDDDDDCDEYDDENEEDE